MIQLFGTGKKYQSNAKKILDLVKNNLIISNDKVIN